jgi:hypothetical protein
VLHALHGQGRLNIANYGSRYFLFNFSLCGCAPVGRTGSRWKEVTASQDNDGHPAARGAGTAGHT